MGLAQGQGLGATGGGQGLGNSHRQKNPPQVSEGADRADRVGCIICIICICICICVCMLVKYIMTHLQQQLEYLDVTTQIQ